TRCLLATLLSLSLFDADQNRFHVRFGSLADIQWCLLSHAPLRQKADIDRRRVGRLRRVRRRRKILKGVSMFSISSATSHHPAPGKVMRNAAPCGATGDTDNVPP